MPTKLDISSAKQEIQEIESVPPIIRNDIHCISRSESESSDKIRETSQVETPSSPEPSHTSSVVDKPRWRAYTMDDALQENIKVKKRGSLSGGTKSVTVKKRQYNVEVDPARYRKIVDENGVRFACSLCGNIYKWRKSLNKHWKEKHADQTPPPLDAPIPKDPRYETTASQTRSTIVIVETANQSMNSAASNNRQRRIHKREGVGQDLESIFVDKNQEAVVTKLHPAFCLDLDKNIERADEDAIVADRRMEMSPVDDQSTLSDSCRSTKSGDDSDNENNTSTNSGDLPSSFMEPLDLSTKTLDEENAEGGHFLNGIDDSRSSKVSSCRDNRHERGQRMPNEEPNKYLECSICSYISSSMRQMNKHFGRLHKNELRNKQGTKAAYDSVHMSKSSSPGRIEATQQNYGLECPDCCFTSRSTSDVRKHMVAHSAIHHRQCMVCSLNFERKWDLVAHFDSEHGCFVNPYKLPPTELSTDLSPASRKRGRSYSPQKASLAEESLEIKTKRRRLHSHSAANNIPNKEEKLEDGSDSDTRDFPWLSDLLRKSRQKDKRSLREEAGERKSYDCVWCAYVGRWRSELLQHMRCCHSKDKPYHCSACKYGSNWKWDVQKHVSKQHGQQSHSGTSSVDHVINREAHDRGAYIVEMPDEYLFNEPTDDSYIHGNVSDTILKSKILALLARARGPHVCTQCPFAGSTQSEMDKHMLIHNNTH